MAVLAFYDQTQRDGFTTNVECECKTHGLTSSRKCGQPPAVVQRLAAEAAPPEYHKSRQNATRISPVCKSVPACMICAGNALQASLFCIVHPQHSRKCPPQAPDSSIRQIMHLFSSPARRSLKIAVLSQMRCLRGTSDNPFPYSAAHSHTSTRIPPLYFALCIATEAVYSVLLFPLPLPPQISTKEGFLE